MPLGPSVPLGTQARSKPSLADSLRRRPACPTGRTSPDEITVVEANGGAGAKLLDMLALSQTSPSEAASRRELTVLLADALTDLMVGNSFDGAALDVFRYEPLPAGHPLFDIPSSQLLLTPHVAGAPVGEAWQLMSDAIIERTLALTKEQ